MSYIGRSILLSAVLFAAHPAYPKTAAELMNEGQMNLYKGKIKEGLRLLEQSRYAPGEAPSRERVQLEQ
jgi:hypothetical protein